MNKMKFWKNILIILYLTKNMQNSIILHLLINNKENKRYKIVKHNIYLYTLGILRTTFQTNSVLSVNTANKQYREETIDKIHPGILSIPPF